MEDFLASLNERYRLNFAGHLDELFSTGYPSQNDRIYAKSTNTRRNLNDKMIDGRVFKMEQKELSSREQRALEKVKRANAELANVRREQRSN